MSSALSLGGLSARELSRRVGKGIGEDDVFGRHVVEQHPDKATPAMRRDYEERNRKSA